MPSKRPQFKMQIPVEMKDWIARQAHRNGTSQSSVVLRAIRESMDALEVWGIGADDPTVAEAAGAGRPAGAP